MRNLAAGYWLVAVGYWLLTLDFSTSRLLDSLLADWGKTVAEERNAFLTVAETARLLQRSTEQVRRYLREGVIPGRRIGGQWFVDRADAETFLRKRREGSDFATSLATSDPDPLGLVIAIGGSGGGDVAGGMAGYLRSLTGERQT